MDWNRDLNEYGALQSHSPPRFSLGPNDNLDIPLPPSSYSGEQNFGQRPQHRSSSFGSASDAGQASEINTDRFGFQDTEFYDSNGAVLLQPPQNDGIARTAAENISRQFEVALENDPTQVNQKNRRGQRRRIRRTSVAATSATSASSGTGMKPSRTSKTTPFPLHARSLSFADPSSANIEYRLASSASKSSISGSLMKIYHDSMENALSCWLTERTCPYDAGVPLNTYLAMTSDSMGQEWGSVWSNRICQRVCRLDNVCFNLRGRSLTRSEDELVEMALRKTIMAFATQWAHSSARSTAEFPQMDSEEFPFFNPRSSESASVEFDRTMQEMFWHQARQALGDTAGITSFRVVFAHMIFAMTQKPLDVSRRLQKLNSGNVASAPSFENDTMSEFDDAANTNTSAFGSFATQSISMSLSPNLAPGSKKYEEGGQHSASASASLDEILELSGPPIFLETALRQMFSFRCKLEKLDSETWANIKRNQDGILNVTETHATSQKSESLLSASDRHTFNLLFWLAIMFDTLSAAMNKRPLVVSDEDSDILEDRSLAVDKPNPGFESNRFQHANVTKEDCDSRDSIGRDSRLWGEFFLHQNNLQQRQNIARWPCSYETAAVTLCDAAPIKVLMYRRVTRLQTILSRRTGPEKLEIAIRDALAIYDYWNSKYAPFIRDCVSHHETLPPRIQSWYVVLAGHWHLAGLLLADIIEGIDETKSGLDSHRILRSSTQLVRELRLDNAFAISDLGRCSSPHSDSTFPQAKEFHTAVNKAALLTEPWTEVLIRSFSKACSVLLEMFPSATQQGICDRSCIEKLQANCESCIQALWYLGKKSDMALLASSVLSTSVRDKIQFFRQNFNRTAQDILRYGEREVDGTIDNISSLGSWNADEPLTFDFSDVPLDAGFFKF